MQRRIVNLTTMYVALILCMTAGWHTWPLGIGLAFWVFGYRIIDDKPAHISDAELYTWLNGA